MQTKEIVIEIPQSFQDELLKLVVLLEQQSGIAVDQVYFTQGGNLIPLYDRSKRMKQQ